MNTNKIYSRLKPKVLLVSILDPSDHVGRMDAAGADEILQVSVICLPQSKIIFPHKHKDIPRNTVGTQEAWVVISGLLQANIYDVDDSLIDTISLGPGMCMTLYNGGHNFEVISSDAVIYEIKNGPYYGADFDSQPVNR